MSRSETEVAVIGAGPAGLMAAEMLARAGRSVTVYERMASPARKLLMAGRGGLNLTHSEPLDDVLARYSGTPEPILRAIRDYPPEALMSWAEGLGIPLFRGSSGRIFPKALKASPLVRAWLRRLEAEGVKLETRHHWQGWTPAGALIFGTPDQGSFAVTASATLLALGGASWPRLGADGGWVATMDMHGIPVAPLTPANAGVLVPWTDHVRLRHAGEALKRIAVSMDAVTVRGEAVVTAYGLEGGAIYAIRPHVREALRHARQRRLTIDLRPDESHASLAARLAAAGRKETLSNVLRKRISLAPAAIALMREGTAGRLPADADGLAALIKSVPLVLTGIAGLERAISTAGGLRLDALDDGLMLRAKPGIFAAGEMLDWEAPTGGYLLQACFSTAVLAAQGLDRWLARRTGGSDAGIEAR